MEEKNQQEQIELYIAGELTGSDLKEFEEQMKEDHVLKRRVQITKDVNERFDDALFAKKLKAIAEPLHEKYIDNAQSPLAQYRWLIVAIVVLGVIGALVWMNWSGTNDKSDDIENVSETEQDIFAMYYEAYEPSVINRGTSAEENLLTALEYYENGNYEAAIPLLEPLITAENTTDELKIVLGISYLNTENIESAVTLFESIANDEASLTTEIGQWYLVLTHIKSKNDDLAKPILEQLANAQSGKYSKLAEEILSKID